MQRASNQKAGFVFLTLFGGLFAAAGLAAGVSMLPGAIATGDGEKIAVGVILPLVFSLVGGGVIWLAFFSRRTHARQQELKARYPEQPWMWNEEWAARRISGDGKAQLGVWWVFALVWNAISAPLLWQIPQELMRKGLGPPAIALLFPLVGFGLLAAAIRATLHWHKFGVAFFEPKTLPGVVGGKLAGMIHASSVIEPESEIRLHLACINQVTSGSGDNRSTHEHVRWESEYAMPASRLQRGAQGSSIPVGFTIPYDCQPSDDENPRSTIFWRLEVSAPLPGLDFVKRFIVPVFRTAESSEEVTRDDEAIPELIDPGIISGRLPISKASIEHTSAGELDIWLGPMRNVGTTLFLATFTAVWTSITVGLVHWTDALPIQLGFGFFSVLLIFFTGASALGTSHIRVRGSELWVERGVLGMGADRRYARDEIEKIEEEPGSQHGTRVFYRLRLRTRSGGTRTIAAGIGDKVEARNLVNAIRRELGLRIE